MGNSSSRITFVDNGQRLVVLCRLVNMIPPPCFIPEQAPRLNRSYRTNAMQMVGLVGSAVLLRTRIATQLSYNTDEGDPKEGGKFHKTCLRLWRTCLERDAPHFSPPLFALELSPRGELVFPVACAASRFPQEVTPSLALGSWGTCTSIAVSATRSFVV